MIRPLLRLVVVYQSHQLSATAMGNPMREVAHSLSISMKRGRVGMVDSAMVGGVVGTIGIK